MLDLNCESNDDKVTALTHNIATIKHNCIDDKKKKIQSSYKNSMKHQEKSPIVEHEFPDKNKSVEFRNAYKNDSSVDIRESGKVRRIDEMYLVTRGEQMKKGLSHLISKLCYPAETSYNIRLFGGMRGIEGEIERLKELAFVIHPQSFLRQYWDLLVLIMLLINMVVLPLDIAFFNSNTIVGFHAMSDILCMMDVIMNFRTGFRSPLQKYEFELESKKIVNNYLKTWFTLDLISSLPLHYIILAVAGKNVTLGLKGASRALKFLKMAKLLNLLKLLRLSRIIRGISKYEEVYCITTGLLRYVKLICMMFMVAHWNGCLHFLVPMLQEFPESCWVQLCRLVDKPWYIQYGWALFKTLSHMLCIGYGRFVPVLLSEAVVTIFTMVTGATFYALFIAHSIAYIIHSDSSKLSYEEQIKQVEEYMNYRKVPGATQKRVSNYYEHKYLHGRFFNEQEILGNIVKPLKEDIDYYTINDTEKEINDTEKETICLLELITPYVDKIKEDLNLSSNSKALLICDAFIAQSRLFFKWSFTEKLVSTILLMVSSCEIVLQEILYHTCYDVIKNTQLFVNASVDFVTGVLNGMKFEVYLSGDYIVREGEPGIEMFFILNGFVKTFMNGKYIGQMTKGGYFGDIAMFTDHGYNLFTIKAESTCDVFSLPSQHLNFMLSEYPEMRSVLKQSALDKLKGAMEKIESTRLNNYDGNLAQAGMKDLLSQSKGKVNSTTFLSGKNKREGDNISRVRDDFVEQSFRGDFTQYGTRSCADGNFGYRKNSDCIEN